MVIFHSYVSLPEGTTTLYGSEHGQTTPNVLWKSVDDDLQDPTAEGNGDFQVTAGFSMR